MLKLTPLGIAVLAKEIARTMPDRNINNALGCNGYIELDPDTDRHLYFDLYAAILAALAVKGA